MNKLQKINFISIIILFSTITAFSQSSKEAIVSAYLLNFAKYINWENEAKMESFNIVIICNKSKNTNIYKALEQNKKTKNIKVTILEKPINNILINAQMIFLASEKEDYYNEIFDFIEYKSILLVSENQDNERIMMVNLYKTGKGEISFKINKLNILNQKLTINEKLLLLGGTEVDIAELYMSSKESLRNLEKEIESYHSQFKELNKKIFTSKNKLKKQNKIIDDQKNDHSNLQNEITILQNNFEKQNTLIKEKQKSLNLLDANLRNSKNLLGEQIHEIETGRLILEEQQKHIADMNKSISKKDKELGSQVEEIKKQRFVVYLFGAIILLIIALVMFMIKANNIRKKKNTILKIQKERINNSYEEIRSINEQLNEKNENLALTLKELGVVQQQIIQSEKMASIGILTAGIAHEINNPVNFISSGINSLQKDLKDVFVIIDELNKINKEDSNINKTIEQIDHLKEEYYFDEAIEAIPQTIKDISIGVERTTEIINGLRIFSRVGDKDFKLFSINKIIDNSLLMLKSKYKNKISIVCNYEENISNIDCNPGKLIQVFINIINNSIDALEGKGEIVISTKELNEKVYVTIKDNGKGMDEETKYKIFDPFYTTKDVGAGTGLGLSITYGIVEEHFGEIIVESELGVGTEFKVIFKAHI